MFRPRRRDCTPRSFGRAKLESALLETRLKRKLQRPARNGNLLPKMRWLLAVLTMQECDITPEVMIRHESVFSVDFISFHSTYIGI